MKIQNMAAICLIAMMACTAPSTSHSGGMQTTAKGRLIDDITRDVSGWHNMQHRDCRFSKVVGSKVLSSEAGTTVEAWTIEACEGKQFTYKVTIMPGAGSNFVMVGNLDGSGFKPNS